MGEILLSVVALELIYKGAFDSALIASVSGADLSFLADPDRLRSLFLFRLLLAMKIYCMLF